MMRRVVPAVAAMGNTKGDDLGVGEVMWVMDDLGGSFEEVRVAANRGHPFRFGGRIAIRHIAVETDPVDLVTNLERINGQIGGFDRVELETQLPFLKLE